MKKVRTYFALTVVLLAWSFSAYAEGLSKQDLFYPCSYSGDPWAGSGSSGADMLQPARVVQLEMVHEAAPDHPFLLHADWALSRQVKLGAGYNFSGFSDDPDEFSIDNEGVFIYLIGQM